MTIAVCPLVSQGEIEALYQRFRSLDRGHKVSQINVQPAQHAFRLEHRGIRLHMLLQGYISAEEFMNIPELSINPLAHRLERIFESVNFRVRGLG